MQTLKLFREQRRCRQHREHVIVRRLQTSASLSQIEPQVEALGIGSSRRGNTAQSCQNSALEGLADWA